MKAWSNRITLLLILLFIFNEFFPIHVVGFVIPILTAAVILISMLYSRGLTRIFVIIMLVIGIVILVVQREPVDVWMDGITKNLALICLIIVTPVLSIPINLGNYSLHLANFASRFNKKPHLLFLFISGTFSVLGPITNMGSIYIIHSMLSKLKLPAEFLGRVYARGFSSVNTWSPYFASVFLVVFSLGIPISIFLPFGLLLSFLQVATSNLLFSFKEIHTIRLAPIENGEVENPGRLYELLIVILILIGTIFIVEPILNVNTSVLIILTVVLFAVGWSFYLKMPKNFLKGANSFRQNLLPGGANEISMMMTAGFFGVVLSKTVISNYIDSWWSGFASISILLFIFLTIFLIGLLSFLGVHQIVTISSIIASVSHQDLGIHDITMAMTLLSGWIISTTISPVTPLNAIISNVLTVNIFKIIRWNFLYTVMILGVHTCVIYIVHLLL